MRKLARFLLLLCFLQSLVLPDSLRGEAMLQYFRVLPALERYNCAKLLIINAKQILKKGALF